MTVTNLNVKASYVGDGANDTFAINFDYNSESVIKVYLDGIPQVSGYSIVGSNVVFTAPPAIDVVVLVKRISPRTQVTPFASGGFPPVPVEDRYDEIVHLIQELGDDLGLNVTLSSSSGLATLEFPIEEAGKYIAWNATATALINKVSTFSEWATATDYEIKDVVLYDNGIYVCLANHTSSALFSTDFYSATPKWHLATGIRGEQGDQGADGPAGIKGDTGAAGATGAPGADGADGIFSAIADKTEAETGTDNTKGMSPLRVAQALIAQLPTNATVVNLQSQISSNDTDINELQSRVSKVEGVLPTNSISGSQPIINNQAVPLDISGVTGSDPLLADADRAESIRIFLEIQRDDTVETRFSSVNLVAQYINDTWYIARESSSFLLGNPDGIVFSIVTDGVTNEGQVQYTSDNMSGGIHTGTLKYIGKEISRWS